MPTARAIRGFGGYKLLIRFDSDSLSHCLLAYGSTKRTLAPLKIMGVISKTAVDSYSYSIRISISLKGGHMQIGKFFS